jgi:hypothetical protein
MFGLPPLLVFPPSSIADVEHAITLIERGKARLARPILRQLPERLRMDIIELTGWQLLAADQRRAARERGDLPASPPKPPTDTPKESVP